MYVHILLSLHYYLKHLLLLLLNPAKLASKQASQQELGLALYLVESHPSVTLCKSQTERNRGYSTEVNYDRASILGSRKQKKNNKIKK